MKKLIYFCFIIALISSYSIAQSEAGAIWLLIPSSSTLNGMGEIGVCLPENDPVASYFNPANGLGAYKSISVTTADMETKWLQNLASDIKLKHSYFGFNLIPIKYPIKLVVHRQNTILDLGEQIYIDEYGNELGRFSSKMSARAYSVSAQYSGKFWKIPVDVSCGISRKNVVQNLIPDEYLPSGSGTSKNIFYDTGVLAAIPLTLNIKNKWNFSISPAFGYSMSNIGDSIVFIDAAKADPAPRLARTGISLSLKIDLNDNWNLFEFRGGRAAADVLIKPRINNEEPIRYQSGFGDINFIENVILSRSDPELEVSRGHEVSFLDIYSRRFGRRIDVAGKINLFEYGYGINSTGMLNLLHYLTKARFLSLVNQYVNVRYNYSKWTGGYDHPLDKTEFSSYTWSINNIDKIVKWVFERYGYDKLSLNRTGLTIVGGMNWSTMNFSDETVQKKAKVKFGQGYDFGIETKLKYIIPGISLTQYSADYRLYYRFKISESYHYLTFYSLIPYSIFKPITVLGGAQISNCIGRTVKLEDNSGSLNCKEYSFNYGLITGIDLMINSAIGFRISYNYWLRNIKNEFIENKPFRLSGIRTNLLIKL